SCPGAKTQTRNFRDTTLAAGICTFSKGVSRLEQEKKTREATLRDFFSVVFRRKWIIIVLFVTSTSFVTITNVRTPVYYEAVARVLVSRGQKENILMPQIGLLSWKEELSSEVETAKSAAVATNAQKILDEKRNKEGKPRYKIDGSSVDAGVVGESNVVEVSYRSTDPEMCVEVTNAIAEGYMKHSRERFSIPELFEFFREEKEKISVELEKWKKQRSDFLNSRGLSDPTAERRETLGMYRDTQNTLKDIVGKRIAQDESVNKLSKILQEDPDFSIGFVISGQVGNEGTLAEISRQLILLNSEREKLLTKYTPTHPDVKAVEKQIVDLTIMMRKQLRDRLELEKLNLDVLRAREKEQRMMLAGFRAELRQYPEVENKLEEVDRMIALYQASYKELDEKEIQARITDQTTSPEKTAVILLNPATKAFARKTKDYVRIALAPIFSIVIGLGLSFFVDGLDHSFKTTGEVEEFLRLRVLAAVPEVRKRRIKLF
ncbi:MAG: hypothetical protein QME66_09780, partial [Candidatus Eisenbacteria bacterium]|nr:hypothetical protein [Candidatus Eisenbacteria bacterium]